MKNTPTHHVLILLLYLTHLTAAAQQPSLEWARRYNGIGSTSDFAIAIAVDADGNSYVAGNNEVEEDIYRLTVVKYSPSGEQLWSVQQSQNSYVVAVAADESEGVYVMGYTYGENNTAEYVVIRYNASTGEEMWTQQYDDPVGTGFYGRAIAVDNQGKVYVTGYSNSPTTPDYATLCYNAATGEEIWASRYDGPNGSSDVPVAIAVDNNGSVYVTGTSGENYATIRYAAATGQQIWARQYEGPSNNYSHIATGIAVDSQGGVFITGYNIAGDDFNDRDYVTVRYDARTGEQSWAQQYNSPSNDSDAAIAIAVDNTGGVYVTGYSYSYSSELDEFDSDYLTIGYAASTGEQLWTQRYDRPDYDQATAIATDNTGGVYVTGYGGTIRYDANTGEQVWLSAASATALGVDRAGGLYVTGSSTSLTTDFSSDLVTVRFNAATGESTWEQRHDGTGSMSDYPVSVALDAAGNSYVTGTSVFPGVGSITMTTIKYAPSGEQLWVVHFSGYASARDIAVDNAGGVYVTGESYSDPVGFISDDFITVRYDAATGQQSWAQLYDSPSNDSDAATAIAVDNKGGVYVTGYSYSGELSEYSSDYATVRYDAATGQQVWASRYDGKSYDNAKAIAIDAQGSVYVTGYSESESTSSDYATVRYDAATGEQIWVQRYDGPGYDAATAIAVDNMGGVYVTGDSDDDDADYNSDYATIRYDAVTGEQVWVNRYTGPGNLSNFASDLAVDSLGNVYVTGYSNSNANRDTDFATVRYDAATGRQIWVSTYRGPAGSYDVASAIAADNRGGVYVTGSSNSNFFTSRYNATTGEEEWSTRYNEHGIASAMALDPSSGRLVVTGYSLTPETGADFLTLSYSLQRQCPVMAEAPITGSTTAATNATGSGYALPGTEATSFAWRITDPDGNPYTNFTGQGTSAITVDWPAAPNAYKVSVTYGAEEGCSSQTSVMYVHVYDPGAGFVTGSGWSNSPANPAYEFMERSGRLYWGFAAKYSNGSRVQGSALVFLETGSSVFHSTNVEDGSLVISGNRAFFRGSGTLTRREGLRADTDERRFGYQITAADGQLHAGSEPDQLRIRIWVVKDDGSEGAVVYDNQVDCPSASTDSNAPACDGIDRGSIVIHKSSRWSISSLFALSAADGQGEDASLNIYPTAVTEKATVRFSLEQPGDYVLELYDMKGALVKHIATGAAEAGKHYGQEFSVVGIGSGLYIARLTSGGKVQSAKLIVQR